MRYEPFGSERVRAQTVVFASIRAAHDFARAKSSCRSCGLRDTGWPRRERRGFARSTGSPSATCQVRLPGAAYGSHRPHRRHGIPSGRGPRRPLAGHGNVLLTERGVAPACVHLAAFTPVWGQETGFPAPRSSQLAASSALPSDPAVAGGSQSACGATDVCAGCEPLKLRRRQQRRDGPVRRGPRHGDCYGALRPASPTLDLVKGRRSLGRAHPPTLARRSCFAAKFQKAGFKVLPRFSGRDLALCGPLLPHIIPLERWMTCGPGRAFF